MKPWHGDVDLEPIGDPNLGAIKVETSNLLKELKEIESWFDNRPSATMDPFLSKRERMISRARELRSQIREAGRPKHRRPTDMMKAQQMPEFDASKY
jgi:hypothetical protein